MTTLGKIAIAGAAVGAIYAWRTWGGTFPWETSVHHGGLSNPTAPLGQVLKHAGMYPGVGQPATGSLVRAMPGYGGIPYWWGGV
jgi:hypothetical protein